MKYRQRKGFAMIVILLVMSLFGLTMTVLSNSSMQMGGQTTSEVLKVNNKNILASGIAWARANENHLKKQSVGFTMELDTSAFDITKASCMLRVDSISENGIEVNIEAVCYKGRRQYRKNHELQL